MSRLDDILDEAVKPKLKQNIKDLMLEIIGEDVPNNGTYPKEQVFAVNQTKAYQRKQVNEL